MSEVIRNAIMSLVILLMLFILNLYSVPINYFLLGFSTAVNGLTMTNIAWTFSHNKTYYIDSVDGMQWNKIQNIFIRMR